jgi:hypothetical protein
MLSSGRRLRKELKNLENNKDDSIHLYVLDEVSAALPLDLKTSRTIFFGGVQLSLLRQIHHIMAINLNYVLMLVMNIP